jgi:hypothetical protein
LADGLPVAGQVKVIETGKIQKTLVNGIEALQDLRGSAIFI